MAWREGGGVELRCQHDGEDDEREDGAHVDENLHKREEFRFQEDEESGHADEHEPQTERRAEEVAQRHDPHGACEH